MKLLLTTAICATTVLGASSAAYVDVRPSGFETINAIASGPVNLLHDLDRKSLGLFCPLDSPDEEFGLAVAARCPFRTELFEVSLAMGIQGSEWPRDVHAFNFVANTWMTLTSTHESGESAGVRVIQKYVVQGPGFVDPRTGSVLVRFLWPNRVAQPVWLDYVSFRYFE